MAKTKLDENDPLLDFLESGSEYAPGLGTVAGGLYGGAIGALAGFPGGPAAMIPMGAAGAGVGSSLGGALGGAAKAWGDQREFDREQGREEAQQRDFQAEQDRRARMDAVQLAKMQKEQEAINRRNALTDLLGRFL